LGDPCGLKAMLCRLQPVLTQLTILGWEPPPKATRKCLIWLGTLGILVAVMVGSWPHRLDPDWISGNWPGILDGGAVHAQSGDGGIPRPIRYRLPSGLEQYRYDPSVGDYLDEITSTEDGSYLQWSYYPVPVYVEDPPGFEQWRSFVEQAITEWSDYIPLRVVATKPEARITIERAELVRGISGAARPTVYFASDGTLQHRVTILIGQQRGLAEITAVARHEIGHALGLWGHSPELTDLMFGGNHADQFGGRRYLRVPTIRARDLNTLKRVYEQPTYMGQTFPESLRRLYE
jgi:predicted Zn-dependent protease